MVDVTSGTAGVDEPRPGPVTDAVLVGATLAAVASLLVLGAMTGRPNWPVYLAVVVVGLAVALAVDRRHPFSFGTRVGLAIFAIGHVAGGMVTVGDDVLYATWLFEPIVRYDNVQHAIGFGVLGRATWEVLRPRLGVAATTPIVVWWVVATGAATWGAVNEVIEWVMTLTIPGTDVGGYDNTVRDLVANLVGGVAMATWMARHVGDEDRDDEDGDDEDGRAARPGGVPERLR